ncbi:MAG: TIGR04283 family arsenosugar biosynthesis glycosyltransferase [Halioglobus sp.]
MRGTFIIPTLNETQQISDLLSGLAQNYPEFERIVVDGGSTDATVTQAMPLCDKLLESTAGRAQQMNLGAQVASGDYLFFLHADTRLGPDASALKSLMLAQPVWGFCRVQLSGSSWAFRVIEWFMNTRSRGTQVATGDQMIFVHRDAFDELGGYDNIELMEDVALSKRLKAVSPPSVIQSPVLTSSRRWEEGGIARTVLRMWALRFAYWCGASPRALWQYYYGR